MKNLILAAICGTLCVCLPATSSLAQHPDNGGGNQQGTGDRERMQKVEPGESHTNGDGATLEVNGDSSKGGTISPKEGDGDSVTTVRTKKNCKSKIFDLDDNDTVELGNSNESEIEMEGSGPNGDSGITLGGNSTVSVTNTSGTDTLSVTFPSGDVQHVGPGSQVTFNT